jgi:predicted acetyltransferase
MRRILSPASQPSFRYLVMNGGQVGAYAVYAQVPEPQAAGRRNAMVRFGNHYSLFCQDLVWNDAASALGLLAYFANHRAFGVDLMWAGPFDEPLGWFLPEQDIRLDFSVLWMLRLLDVRLAFESRGYPPGLTAELSMSIDDDTLSGSGGAIRLEISGGSAVVTAIDRADMHVDIRTLAAIYTGWLSARDAVLTGRLLGATEGVIATLDAVFAGNKPWVIDHL